MGKQLRERNGSRIFERAGGWNAIDYTVITRSNKFAQYADNYDSKADKLNLTCFKYSNHITPLNRFARLVNNITLEDFSVISRQDTEGCYWMEISPDKRKVRLYREVAV